MPNQKIQDLNLTFLQSFGLTDNQLELVFTSIARVNTGADSINKFVERIKQLGIKDSPQVIAAIIRERFIPLNIKGVQKVLSDIDPTSSQITEPKENNHVVPKNNATFSSVDDDEEINQIKQQAPATVTTAPNYEAQADAIIASFGYNESDEVMRKRLQTVVIARLRGVRDDLEAIDVLTKSKKIGGLEFTGDQATSLLRLMAGKQPLATNGKSQPKPTPTPPPNLPTEVALPAKPNLPLPTSIAGLPVIDEEDGLPIIRMPEAPAMNGRGGTGAARVNEQVKEQPKPAPIVQTPVATPTSIAPRQSPSATLPPAEPQPYPTPIVPSTANAAAAAKPQLDGVKVVSRLVGPVEELAQMTLIDFRRLGSTPEAMVQGIADKIELLSRESFAKRHEAIAAWQQSEVTKFYRLLGQLSLTEGKPIETVIAERRQAGKPTLTLEEFNELVELHTKLRY